MKRINLDARLERLLNRVVDEANMLVNDETEEWHSTDCSKTLSQFSGWKQSDYMDLVKSPSHIMRKILARMLTREP